MKYIDRVYKVNADEENYISGVRVELSFTEIELLYKALEFAEELDVNLLYKEHSNLMEKLVRLQECADKNIRNIEIQ